jgi:hypothetical protein
MNTKSSTSVAPSCAQLVQSDALREFHEQVLKLAKRFTAKEAARAMLVTTQHMRSYGIKHDIQWASPEGRTPIQLRRLRKELMELGEETRVKRLAPIRPSPGPNGLVLTPAQEFDSRKAWWNAENEVIQLVATLAKTHTLHEVRRKTKLKLRSLRKMAYNHSIVFANQIVPFDEEAANIALVTSGLMGFDYPGLPAEARTCLVGFLMPGHQAI